MPLRREGRQTRLCSRRRRSSNATDDMVASEDRGVSRRREEGNARERRGMVVEVVSPAPTPVNGAG
jgi:hypothetical protein